MKIMLKQILKRLTMSNIEICFVFLLLGFLQSMRQIISTVFNFYMNKIIFNNMNWMM